MIWYLLLLAFPYPWSFTPSKLNKITICESQSVSGSPTVSMASIHYCLHWNVVLYTIYNREIMKTLKSAPVFNKMLGKGEKFSGKKYDNMLLW
jgi:hypothetical protein